MSLVQHILALPFGHWYIVAGTFLLPIVIIVGVALVILWHVEREEAE